MRRALAAAVVLILVGSLAAADDDALPPPPTPVRVEARLDGDTARFAVRYVERATRERRPEDLDVSYSLPARGLVTAASVSEGGVRHVLDLVDAGTASDAFNTLFETPPGRARRWAVLITAQPNASSFSIASAVARQATLVVDVQITAPTCFHRDARYVAIPAEWRSRVPASMHVSERAAVELEASCPRSRHDLEPRPWMKFAAGGLASRAGGANRIGAYAHRASLGKTNVVKVELNLAARMSEVPLDLVTAIVVDASRSTTKEQLEAQRDTIAAYLRAVPQSRVQVIEYAREARAVLPSWMSASQAAPRVERALFAMQRKNGSNIDEGLREAGKWLDLTTGTRRVLLFTDENLTTRSQHTHAIDEALPANTLVHVIALGGDGLARDDDAKLARIAAKTKGMSVRGGERASLDTPAQPLDATLLVRPISFDHVRVRTPGWTSIGLEDHACPDEDDPSSLGEGAQCTWWGQGNAVSSPFVVEGFLWGERVERVMRADLGRSLDVVRELSAMYVLEAELQNLAERAARAVNSVWSLYGTWGGDDGYAGGFGFGSSGWGTLCGGCVGHIGGIGSSTRIFGVRPDLSIELTRIVQTCRPAQTVDVEVETTFEEIVDVEVTGVSAELRACVETALWNAWLVVPGAPPRTVTQFSVSPT